MTENNDRFDKVYDKLFEISNKLTKVDTTLQDVKIQTTKTNGRVDKLEVWKIATEAVEEIPTKEIKTSDKGIDTKTLESILSKFILIGSGLGAVGAALYKFISVVIK